MVLAYPLACPYCKFSLSNKLLAEWEGKCPLCGALIIQPWMIDVSDKDNDLESTPQYDGVILGCYNCKELLIFGADECSNCKATYSVEFWRDYASLINDKEESTDNNELDDYFINLIKPPDIDYDTRLCCNLDSEHCVCDQPIEWFDTYEIPIEVNNLTYKLGSVCEDCEYFWTARCIPYRNFAFDFLISGEIKTAIDGCINFKTEERILT